MAEKRMFAKQIIDSDLFLDMPLSTQALYFHLSMRADDDGFVNNPKKVMRMIGADEDSLKLLIAKKFLIPFDSGIVVIKHWRIHNYIRKDTYKTTSYYEEKALLTENANGEYIIRDESVTVPSQVRNETVTGSLQVRDESVTGSSTQIRIDKNRIDKNNIVVDVETSITPQTSSDSKSKAKNRRFIPPTLDEVRAYCFERHNAVNAEAFIDYYESNGWKVGRNSMKDWKAAIRRWEMNSYNSSNNSASAEYSADDPMNEGRF